MASISSFSPHPAQSHNSRFRLFNSLRSRHPSPSRPSTPKNSKDKELASENMRGIEPPHHEPVLFITHDAAQRHTPRSRDSTGYLSGWTEDVWASTPHSGTSIHSGSSRTASEYYLASSPSHTSTATTPQSDHAAYTPYPEEIDSPDFYDDKHTQESHRLAPRALLLGVSRPRRKHGSPAYPAAQTSLSAPSSPTKSRFGEAERGRQVLAEKVENIEVDLEEYPWYICQNVEGRDVKCHLSTMISHRGVERM
ncbi:hypothetical protein K439DRAFT_870707 [Ramaria rubella]|nr:hypothetical protein K439DRAFT_870707 [Ramaria rubella]